MEIIIFLGIIGTILYLLVRYSAKKQNKQSKLQNFVQQLKEQVEEASGQSSSQDYSNVDSYKNTVGYQKSLQAYKNGDFTTSAYELSVLLNHFPKIAELYFYRGLCYSKLGDYARALSDFKKTLELDAKIRNLYFHLAEAYWGLHETEKARKAYQTFLTITKNPAEAYANKAKEAIRIAQEAARKPVASQTDDPQISFTTFAPSMSEDMTQTDSFMMEPKTEPKSRIKTPRRIKRNAPEMEFTVSNLNAISSGNQSLNLTEEDRKTIRQAFVKLKSENDTQAQDAFLNLLEWKSKGIIALQQFIKYEIGMPRERLLDFLAQIGTNEAIELMLSAIEEYPLQEKLMQVFQKQAPDFLFHLIPSLANFGFKETAIEVFLSFGLEALPALEKGLDHSDDIIRLTIMDILGMMNGRDVEPLLIKALQDKNYGIKFKAVDHLEEMGYEVSLVDFSIRSSKDDILESDDVIEKPKSVFLTEPEEAAPEETPVELSA